MLRVTLRGIRAHLVRFLLTAFAVTLGVALVAGTFVLTDSINQTFDKLIDQGTEGVDVTVRGQEGAAGNAGGSFDAVRQGLPLSLQSRLAALPGVQRVSPDLQGSAVLVGKDGTPVRNGGAPTLGFPFTADDPVVHIVEGRGPVNRTEVAVEKTTLEKSGLQVGDSTRALLGGTPGPVKIVGEAQFDAALAGATMVLVDPATARAEWAADGTTPSFSLTAAEGVSAQQLKATVLNAHIPGAEVVTSAQVREETRDAIHKALGFITYFLLIFALVSLLVGAFIIANTFSMLVAQRTRELALLRAVGASRGQVLRVVLGEAVVLGLFGSALGLGLGILLGQGLQALFATQGLQTDGAPVLPRTVIVSVLVGVLVTVLSAVLPGLRASRVAPVAALRDDVAVPVGGVRRRGIIGGVVLVVALALAVPAVLADPVKWPLVGLGAALLVIGSLVAAPVTTRPIVRIIAWPFTVRGVVGKLARENALRNPRRTATTASALMIGLALMGGVSVLAASTKASVSDLVSSQLKADYVLNGGNSIFPPTVGTAVAELPDVAQVANIGFVTSKIDGKGASAIAADPASLLATVKMDVTSGTLAADSARDIFVSKSAARDRDWRVGQTVSGDIGSLNGQKLTIKGVFADSQVLNGPQVIFTRALYLKAVPQSMQGDYLLYVKAKDGVDPAALRTELVDAVKPFIVVSVQDADEFTSSQADQVNQILGILYGLLALSVIIAILGIVNTLALSVFERTREIGLLRAVGLNRPQLRRMITVESISTAVFGAVLGLALGLTFGLLVQHGLRTQGLESLAIPWGTLIGVLIAAAVAGVVAAILPAWRAVRLDVLRAITTE
ncbi:ABC transporter permease [Spongisporangium articulatum]|uniref:ABC transporter permease n=1 Tax=Spongisporangium articulatum TaxID=3362603 RepID=A0ABW8ARU7_9ACTN